MSSKQRVNHFDICLFSSISARYRMDVTLKLTSFVNVPNTLNQRYMNMTKDAVSYTYKNPCVKRPLSKRPKIGFQDQFLLNAGQKY